jgi:hypothetical protein
MSPAHLEQMNTEVNMLVMGMIKGPKWDEIVIQQQLLTRSCLDSFENLDYAGKEFFSFKCCSVSSNGAQNSSVSEFSCPKLDESIADGLGAGYGSGDGHGETEMLEVGADATVSGAMRGGESVIVALLCPKRPSSFVRRSAASWNLTFQSSTSSSSSVIRSR